MKNPIFLFISLLIVDGLSAQINNQRGIHYNWKTDMEKNIVPLSEITAVVPRNTFPTIDYPAFIGAKEGLKSFFKHEPVLVVAIGGFAKAYPLNMLTMHEISNDTLAGIPILPTYCPLCNSGIVFDRRLQVNGKETLLEFEVSGMLRNSDMIMADKLTESWWQQLTGQAIVGKLSPSKLKIIPSLIISIEEFFQRYPDGKILSPKTGSRSESSYGLNPYRNYDDPTNSPYSTFINSDKVDKRLPPMERVVNVSVEEKHKIYPFSIIAKKGVVNDSFAGRNVVIFYTGSTVSVLNKQEIRQSKNIGSVTVFNSILNDKKLTFTKSGNRFKDNETSSYWDITGKCLTGLLAGKQLSIEPHGNHFAFAWLAFHPETVIFK